MTVVTTEPGKRTWSGGGYPDREGIEITADPNGITVTGWYDGGPDLEIEARMTWDEIEALRGEQAPR